jgi:hypothetical protein
MLIEPRLRLKVKKIHFSRPSLILSQEICTNDIRELTFLCFLFFHDRSNYLSLFYRHTV